MRRKRLSIPTAIILASLIVSAAILYAARTIAEQGGAGYPPAAPSNGIPIPPRAPLELPSSPEARPVKPSGVAVGADTPLKPGDTVLAEDQGLWYRAQVVSLEDGGRVRVHYRGWDPRWDRSIPRAELQMEGADRDRD